MVLLNEDYDNYAVTFLMVVGGGMSWLPRKSDLIKVFDQIFYH